MPVFTREVRFPVQLSAPDAVAADRDAMDHAVAAVQHVEARDVSGSLTIGKLTVTVPPPAPTYPRWTVVYGCGEHAMAQVLAWLAEGNSVDSRIVRGTWVHRPVPREQAGTESAADLAAFPWRVYGLPRHGDKGRPWLVNAFNTKQRAEQFAERHPEYGPLTITCADEAAATADAAPGPESVHRAVMRGGAGGPACGTRRFWEPMTRAWKDVTCPDCLAALDQAAPDGGA